MSWTRLTASILAKIRVMWVFTVRSGGDEVTDELAGAGDLHRLIFIFNKAVDDVNAELNRTASVTYEVTGDATNVEIMYGEVDR